MADWLHKFGKSSNQEEPEDFILIREDAKAADTEPADAEPADAEVSKPETDAALNDTDRLSIQAVEEGLARSMEENKAASESADEDAEAQETQTTEDTLYDTDGLTPLPIEEEREPGLKGFVKAHKRWFIGGGIAVASIAFLTALFFLLSVLTDPMRGYTQTEVVKGNVTHTMETAGTLFANAEYEITSLVSGKIVESKPEVGDTVRAGTVLYKLDDTEAKLAVERAENQLSKSKVVGSTSATDSDKIYSTSAGTIHTVNIRSGSTVSYGQVVCTVKKEDDTVVAVTSPVAGTVSSVNISQGKSVSVNSLIASVTSIQTTNNQKTSVYDQKSNELDVQAAERQLENYTIKSPVSGVIVAKNSKVGDNVGMTNTENPMMVILDTTSLKFTFQVDVYALKDIEPGLEVLVTSDALPGETFAGEVTRIGSQGTENSEGNVMFEVEVSVDKPGDLKAGMKVSAKVILESATNVTYVPHRALMEADGENAVVLVKESVAGTLRENDSDPNALDEELKYPWIEVPEGYELATVQYGVADGTNVEIISGLKVGDIVIFETDREPVDLSPAPTETATPATPDAITPKASTRPRASATARPRASDPASDEDENDTETDTEDETEDTDTTPASGTQIQL